ncbi:MAG: vanadium-dependent haloperoxidase [Chitinophagaceae bacterium]
MKQIMMAVHLLILPAFLLVSCKHNDTPANDPTSKVSTFMLLTWNEAGLTAVHRSGALPPMAESRINAAVNIAMHDALNSIVPVYESYAYRAMAVSAANADAAVAQAAHDVLIFMLPPQKTFADSLLNISLASIADGTGKDSGIVLGKAAAAAMNTKRGKDGASVAQIPFISGTMPGQYRAAPPFDTGAAAGFVALAGWGGVQPFGLSAAAQYRPGAPYAVSSDAYAKDFAEIKKMGCMACPDRTADQTEIGRFWLENVPTSINRIAVTLINDKHLNAWQAARLLALVQMAQADANIACFDAKFFYKFWRPITAVRLAEGDGNASTIGDAAWNVLAPPTPPVPDYPSNHAADGGAGLEVVRRFFNTDNINFSATSTILPGVVRPFANLSQAAREISLSRIYVGYHFRMAVDSGEAMGKKVGQYLFENSLKPR